MQIFVVGSPLETARALDQKRLGKQIIETRQVISAISGETSAWAKHPVVKMYDSPEGLRYLKAYLRILEAYRKGKAGIIVRVLNFFIHKIRPCFHVEAYYDQMKRRLYTKDNNHYQQWAWLGESEVNWYWNPETEQWMFYKNKKKVTTNV